MINNLSISIIIPVFNEKSSLNEIYIELSNTLTIYQTWEIIFVDDGSNDGSYQIMKQIAESDNRVIVVRLYKNFGKSDALAVGFDKAKGNIIITIDADLQDDPSEIPKLIDKIEEGRDLVSGWKQNRQDPVSKRIPSKIFNFVTRLFTGIKIHDINCGLKAYNEIVIKTLNIYGGFHRYIPVLAIQKGFSVTEVPVNHRPRKFGKSKYGGTRLFHGFFDLITTLFTTKYYNRPLHFYGFIGLILVLIGLIINIYLTIGWFHGIWIGNRPIFFLGILLLIIGIQFISLGLLGDLFVNISGKSDGKVQSVFCIKED